MLGGCFLTAGLKYHLFFVESLQIHRIFSMCFLLVYNVGIISCLECDRTRTV